MGIIIKPIVTEKQTAITEKFPNRYGFRVSPDANKLEIKKAPHYSSNRKPNINCSRSFCLNGI